MMDFLPLAMPNGKAVPDPTHLPVPMSSRFDQQRHHLARFQVLRVGLPTQAASSRERLGISRLTLLYLVKPPDPVSSGKLVALSRSKPPARTVDSYFALAGLRLPG